MQIAHCGDHGFPRVEQVSPYHGRCIRANPELKSGRPVRKIIMLTDRLRAGIQNYFAKWVTRLQAVMGGCRLGQWEDTRG